MCFRLEISLSLNTKCTGRVISILKQGRYKPFISQSLTQALPDGENNGGA